MNLKFEAQKTGIIMKRFLFIVSVVFIGFGSHYVLSAQTPTAPDEKQAAQPRKRGGIFTMYSLDPLARTLCFNDGKEGMAFANNNWINRCSDLSFAGSNLVTGIETDRLGAIVDLGTADALSTSQGFEDAQGGGTGFASIHLQGGKIMVLKQDFGKQEFQPLREASKLFTELGSSAAAPIKLGHIYVVRITGKKDNSSQQFVKLMVIAFRPEESVTLRWELL
jgi:hypothetical protein